MKRFSPAITALAAVALITACSDDAAPTDPSIDAQFAGAGFGPGGSAEYLVTVTNLTSSQPFTPPAIATHRAAMSLFAVGAPASFGVKEIAENGNLDPLLDMLDESKHVADFSVAAGSPPGPLMPGASVSVELEAEHGAKLISFVSMLICTNDGFTGGSGIRLPGKVGETATYLTSAYDAGTEMNTEDFADLVPPCPGLTGSTSDEEGATMSNPALAENGVIHHHDGITGIEDLEVAVHGWTDPVARIFIERIR